MILYKEDIKRLEDLHSYIDLNLADDLSLKILCKIFSMSSAKMQRHFSFYFHQTIHHYILIQRMNKAKALLESRNNCVSDVALLVGYKDRTSFTRSFIKFFHERPIDHLKSGQFSAIELLK